MARYVLINCKLWYSMNGRALKPAKAGRTPDVRLAGCRCGHHDVIGYTGEGAQRVIICWIAAACYKRCWMTIEIRHGVVDCGKPHAGRWHK